MKPARERRSLENSNARSLKTETGGVRATVPGPQLNP